MATPYVMDSSAAGTLYLTPVRRQTFEENNGNTSTVRIEANGIFIERRLGAIAAGALIPGQWERAIALAIIAGLMGLLVTGVLARFAPDAEDLLRLTASGLILGVMAGALLGVAVFWLRELRH